MKTVELKRMVYTDNATFGHIYVNGTWVMFTLELPWKDNAKNISCIPVGEYALRLTTTQKTMPAHYEGVVYEIVDVPGRSAIKIHVANYPSEIKGCIGGGLGVDTVREMVTSSKDALKDFMDAMEMDKEAIILIT